MVREEGEFAASEGAFKKQAREGRSVFLPWLLFYLVCTAGIIGLTWSAPAGPLDPWIRGWVPLLGCLLMPLASLLVPIFWIRRTSRRQRKFA